ncbi:MAG: murein DD-endopeptidase MepM/ murein hydrolase activator NlpD [Cellvibrionaceae bacterium]|jgi:murein DD-endopeptidase MepM/ murein hydrolase activator NlpD
MIVAMKIILKVLLLFTLPLLANLTAALEINTPWIQGGLILGQTSPENRIRFFKRDVRVNEDGKFVIGLGRDIGPTVKLLEIIPSGVERAYIFDVKQREYREQRIEGVPKRTVQVPGEALTRIRKEGRLTKGARKVDSTRQDFLGEFIWPAKGIISGVYGSRRVYNGEPRRPHYGVDIAAPQGSPVVAPRSGRVTLVHKDMYFSGGTLIVDHGHGVSSTFIHLYKVLVKEGEQVEQGQLIAEIGSSGRATGPHLDWRINWFEQRLDPQLLFDALPEKK